VPPSQDVKTSMKMNDEKNIFLIHTEPSVHIHKKFGKEIKVSYYPKEINKTCSLTKKMHVAEGSIEDYHKLSGFHY